MIETVVTIFCDHGNGSSCRSMVTSTHRLLAMDQARKDGWFVGDKQLCPTHRTDNK